MCSLQNIDSSRVLRSKKAAFAQLGNLQDKASRDGCSFCPLAPKKGKKPSEELRIPLMTATGASSSESEPELEEDSSASLTDWTGAVIDCFACFTGGWPHLSHFIPSQLMA